MIAELITHFFTLPFEKYVIGYIILVYLTYHVVEQYGLKNGHRKLGIITIKLQFNKCILVNVFYSMKF